MKIVIIITHPIQYYAPVFKLLNQQKNLEVKVFYTLGKNAINKFDLGFKKKINWDIPLLDGYDYAWVENSSSKPGSHHFKGIITPKLIDLIKEWRPNVLFVYGWAYESHFKVMRYFKNKIPIVFRGDSTLLDEQHWFRNILRYIFLRWLYRHIDYALYTGANNKDYFKRYGLKENQLHFAPHAIDNKRFSVDRAVEVQKLRQSLGIEKTDILILFAGKFEEKKDPLLLLTAFIEIKRANLHLLYVGSGTLENELRSKAKSICNIHFMPFQNQSYLPVIYQSCDLFCLPSKGPNETWGLSVNEAMASKKCVLVSDKVGCAIDLITSGHNGDVFEARNLTDLVKKLKLLTNDRINLELLGTNAKNKIIPWSFEQQVISLFRIINLNYDS
ncbi:glycosyltransferase family 4 protein [Mucilaginibacter sp. SP1R1]|uniref:glycosyltransferase family 4 protein n=1 Tax=Mucilaginibacter sp. SP1R1 TaxID=2723091 RepID=UPI001825BEC2|nr:glycosyltransferase family 4 protein [Mucilaginibacter sp. SP1R1]MBB6150988.1 glycosyltransferase involved in cell wall biosynthesis [Mucilaginibacter sp. SP1R1]